MIILLGKQLQLFVVLPFHGREFGQGFWRERWDQIPQDIVQTLSYVQIWYAFTNYVRVGLVMLFPLALCVIEDFLLGLNTNCFLYPLAVGGVGCSVVCLLQINWGPQR